MKTSLILSIGLIAGCSAPTEGVVKTASKVPLHPRLDAYVAAFLPELERIPEARKAELRRIAGFVRGRKDAKLTFICTANSRRSHLAQLWAAVASAYYGLDGVRTFSGGTQATAFNPRAVAALERAGFVVEKPGGANPRYGVSFSPEAAVQECFSKRYDDPSNPKEGFVAVMTCGAANRSCPVVLGAALRVAIPYEDPKSADGTPGEAAAYDARCRQIAIEMFFLFSQAE